MSGNMYKSHHLSCYKTDFLNTQNVYLKKFLYTFCNNNFLLSLHLKILICYLQSNGYVYVIVIFLFNVLIDIFIWECSIAEMYILIFLYSFH